MIEFLTANVLNTSTMISVNSNTTTAANLMNPDPLYQYYSSGLNADTTISSITIDFGAATSISRIALKGMNYKEFRMFYDGATANSFAFLNADTTTSYYTGNTDENKYFRFNTIAASTITIEAKKTITANQEKILGQLIIADLTYELSIMPSANEYKPKIVPKQVVHKLSDGGTRIHTVRKKWEVSFGLEYISSTIRDALFSIHDTAQEFYFCPFGTATSWDGILFEAVWDGPFDFYKYSDNAASSGFSGKITLKETPS